MKKPVSLISNDWHIKPSNINEILDLAQQKVSLAKKYSIDKVFILGDIFQSRQSQPLSVLKCFEKVLDIFENSKIQIIAIPGNHDKTSYESKDSFLDSFGWHPALFLMNEHDSIQIDDINFICIPFFSNDVWLKELELSKTLMYEDKNNSHILLSHIAFNGSVNNDGSKVESPISPKLVKDFDAVFLGHYHNYQKVSGEIYHLPSLQQNNFGEDSNKGFTLVNSDGSFEIVKSKFKEYQTLNIDLDTIDKKDFKKIVSDANPTDSFVRIKIKGSEDKIKSIKTDEYKALGYDIKTEQKDVTDSILSVENGDIVTFTDSLIGDEFIKFCELEDYSDIEVGGKYLDDALKTI